MNPEKSTVAANILAALPIAALLIYFIHKVAIRRGMILRPLYLPLMIRVVKSKRRWNSSRREIQKAVVLYRIKNMGYLNGTMFEPAISEYYANRKAGKRLSWIAKPVYDCPICMASLYGALCWLVLYPEDWLYTPLFCMVLSGLIWFVEGYLGRNQVPKPPISHVLKQQPDWWKDRWERFEAMQENAAKWDLFFRPGTQEESTYPDMDNLDIEDPDLHSVPDPAFYSNPMQTLMDDPDDKTGQNGGSFPVNTKPNQA